MQVYKSVESRYVFQDKYFGRKVTIADFPSVIAFFLSNGSEVLSYHIPPILRQLYRLAGIVYGLDRYRFYAASLLFIYDGDANVQAAYKRSLENSSPGGLSDLMEVADVLDDENAPEVHSPDSLSPTAKKALLASPPLRPHSSSNHHHHHHSTVNGGERHHRHSHRKQKSAGSVIIRLIDFAHCTTGDDFLPPKGSDLMEEGEEEEIDDGRIRATFPPTHPNQPDLGFLLGLKSLCAALKLIWEQETVQKDENGNIIEEIEELTVEGEEVFEVIFGPGASKEKLGEGPDQENVWNLEALTTA